MKKSILIALSAAASGLLVACVYPANLAIIAPQPQVQTTAAGH
jgi:hypothetical protein